MDIVGEFLCESATFLHIMGGRSEGEASCRNRFGSESDKDGLCAFYLLGLAEAVETTL